MTTSLEDRVAAVEQVLGMGGTVTFGSRGNLGTVVRSHTVMLQSLQENQGKHTEILNDLREQQKLQLLMSNSHTNTLNGHSTKLKELQAGQKQLQADVTELRADVVELRVGQHELQEGQQELRTDVTQLRSDVATLRSGQEQIVGLLAALVGGGRPNE